MNDKVMKWRSSPLHRKCMFCKHHCYTHGLNWCSAKKKVIFADNVFDMSRIIRPFCRLFEVDLED